MHAVHNFVRQWPVAVPKYSHRIEIHDIETNKRAWWERVLRKKHIGVDVCRNREEKHQRFFFSFADFTDFQVNGVGSIVSSRLVKFLSIHFHFTFISIVSNWLSIKRFSKLTAELMLQIDYRIYIFANIQRVLKEQQCAINVFSVQTPMLYLSK